MNTFLLEAAQHELDRLGESFREGDRGALLAALRVCAQFDLPMPAWAASGYIGAYDEVLNCRVKTWDEAFGPAFPKGANIDAARKRRHLRFQVHQAVLEAVQRDPDTPINGILFEEVGERFNVGKTEAEKLYYSAVRMGAVSATDWKAKARGE